jgi:hypothetical protein
MQMNFPHMRMQIYDAVRQLADEQFQNEMWREPSASQAALKGLFADFDIPFHILFDDTPGLAEDAFETIGDYLANEAEALALKELISELDGLLRRLGGKAEPETYLDDPGWRTIVEKAKAAYQAMKSSGVDEDV